MSLPTLSLTETQAFNALRAFLLGVADVEVIRAQNNEVPEPTAADFIVMTQMAMPRIATNWEDYFDNIVTGSLAGSTLTVSAVERGELSVGLVVRDLGPGGLVLANTVIQSQISGTPGEAGNYQVSPGGQSASSRTLYAGQRTDLVASEFRVQIDVHGPNSANNTKIIEGLFRSEYATDAFAASGFDVTPLYCSDPKQMPFQNAEQQYEYRWVLDAVMQINSVIGTDQAFADELKVDLVPVDLFDVP